ncbi:MAG: hypothetical protein K0R48_1128 [Gammaproteobacteria bacterium]|jgi:hypothetical protein|nr:hypothetical protein [Gammaproteobacteria bacterium]
MASYTYDADFKENEHLHYDEEEQLLFEIEDKVEKSKGRLHKGRERQTRLLLDDYLEKRLYKDLYDPDLGESRASHL